MAFLGRNHNEPGVPAWRVRQARLLFFRRAGNPDRNFVLLAILDQENGGQDEQ
ncbi:hypothetical protein [Neomoorella thermoacetica]|uniref:hypothetical protein n=1 Tax=Neomoorella thermoacetica TaxID=1525 RepID=UPI00031FE967|nr:hypothetical protein [Moorella thermoacetica]